MNNWSFGLEHKSIRDRVLTYEEPGYKLVIGLEASGLKQYDLVGVEEDFQTWTSPAGEQMGAAKREEILSRLESWAAVQRLRVWFGPGQTVEEVLAEMRVAGWTPEVLPDGQTRYHPPRHSLVARLRGLWHACRNVLGV
jgi:hypothetical protein